MNILILTAKCGMGHFTASLSLKQELESENVKVEIVDFYDVIFPRFKKIIYNFFTFLVDKFSKIYNFLYKISGSTNFTPFSNIIEKRIEKLIKRTNPNIIISTFPVCSNYISEYKKNTKSNIKLYTFITDVEANKEWISSGVDMYFVATNETKNQIIKFNIPSEKIKVVGIPVRKEFKEKSLEQIKEYKRGGDLLLKNKKILVKILLTTTFQIILYHSIPYFIYLSFGLKNANYFEFLAIQSVLYISTSCIPFPGTVGVSEGGFLIIYKLLFPIGTLTSAMLLSRGISFYLFVVISGISVLIFTLLNKKSNSNLTNL